MHGGTTQELSAVFLPRTAQHLSTALSSLLQSQCLPRVSRLLSGCIPVVFLERDKTLPAAHFHEGSKCRSGHQACWKLVACHQGAMQLPKHHDGAQGTQRHLCHCSKRHQHFRNYPMCCSDYSRSCLKQWCRLELRRSRMTGSADMELPETAKRSSQDPIQCFDHLALQSTANDRTHYVCITAQEKVRPNALSQKSCMVKHGRAGEDHNELLKSD